MNENIENTENIVSQLQYENEILKDENETLFKTNEILIKEIQKLKTRIKKTQGCGLCIKCIHCQQDPYGVDQI